MHERIKKVRTDNKLSMKDFADRLGSTVASISRYESGDRTPSNAVLTAISREFNVRLEWLQTGEGDMIDPMLNDPTPANLIRTYRNLPERLRELVQVLASMDPEWYKTLDRAFAELERMKAAGAFPPRPDDPDK